jgi:Zn-finger nucleic acid-binding protein/ribosomal protein L40E
MILICDTCHRQWPLQGKQEGETWACACGNSLVTPKPRPFHAAVWHCGSCGAGLPVGAKDCGYCGSGLKPLDGKAFCARCLAYLEVDAKFCGHCGAHAHDASRIPQATERDCPRCENGTRLVGVPVGDHYGEACPRCEGLWLEQAVFSQVVRDLSSDARQTVAGSGLASPLAKPATETTRPFESTVRYVPCPHCRVRMSRQNYLRVSGVIVDTCPEHGIWLDRDELRRVAAFLQQGGVLRAQKQEREELGLQQRHRAEMQKAKAELASRGATPLGIVSGMSIPGTASKRASDDHEWLGGLGQTPAKGITDWALDLFRWLGPLP